MSRDLRSIRALAILALGASLAGCGAAHLEAFSYQFADNQASSLEGVLARLPAPSQASRPTNATGAPLLVATTHDAPRQLEAIDPSTAEVRWSYALDAQTRPEILGDLVLCSDRARLVALDAASGRLRWQRALPDLAYVGAARDGGTVFLAFTVGALGGARRDGDLVAVDAATGSERWRHRITGVLGQPAAEGGVVFVPYERQSISMLDALTGDEIARVRSTDDVIAWVRADPSGIYYGHRGLYRLTSGSAAGTRAAATRIEPPIPSIPPLHEGEQERPVDLEDDGFLPKPGTRSARGRIHLYASPRLATTDEPVAVLDDTYYFVYYRYVFAMNVDGSLRWARILEQDVIGAQVLEGGLFTVGEQGQLRVLDRVNGQDAWSGGSAMQLSSVAIDVAGLPITPSAAAPRPVREVLNEIALDPDNRLVAARAYAVRLLGALPEPEITRDLLDLYQQRSMPRALRDAIAATLRTRTSGSEFLVAALSTRYDFIEETSGPPLELIVPSLIQMHATDAVPGLVQQMNDHETSAAALPIVVQAIAELGDASVVPALRAFLILYRADSTFSEHAEPLVEAARGIFQLGGPEGRELLTALAGEPRTLPLVTQAIGGLYEAEERQARELAAREEADAARAADEAAREARAALPTALSQEQINQVFAEHAETLRDCVAGEVQRNPLLGQVRVVFILTNDGRASEIGVAPSSDELTRCMTERVAAFEFPQFRQRRQRAAFTIALRGGQPTATSSEGVLDQALAPSAPWWTWWDRRAEAGARTTLDAAEDVSLAWWTARPAPERPTATAMPTPAVPEGTDATTLPPAAGGGSASGQGGSSASGGSPWWVGAGESPEGDASEEAPPPAPAPEPAPAEPAQPRGRRGRTTPPTPPTRPGLPSQIQPTAPPAQPSPPAQPAPPAQPETPWWAPAEGG